VEVLVDRRRLPRVVVLAVVVVAGLVEQGLAVVALLGGVGRVGRGVGRAGLARGLVGLLRHAVAVHVGGAADGHAFGTGGAVVAAALDEDVAAREGERDDERAKIVGTHGAPAA